MSESSLHILLVEDDPMVARTLAAILRDRSHEVTIAQSGEEALRCQPCDVLVTDVELGGMSGLDVLEELLLRGEAPRTLVISGEKSVENCRRALHLGAVDFLSKPVNIDRLVRLVEQEPIKEPRAPSSYKRSYRVSRATCDRGPRDLVAFALRCGVGPSARARVATATAEALENAWRHAYPDGQGSVTVEADLGTSELVVRVRDGGQGMDTNAVGRTPVQGGQSCGLARMSALAENLLVRSGVNAGTQIEMRFTIFTACFDESSQTDLSELDWFSPQMARTVVQSLDDPEHPRAFQFSPALAVSIGRLLSGPRPLQDTPATHAPELGA
jgi:CheY-like chemotaxis protein